MSYTHWHVGMKVVCIRVSKFNHYYHYETDHLPQEGAVYTVREIGRWNPAFPNHVTIYLCEIQNRPVLRKGLTHPLELFFYAEDFKPVQHRNTDISIFKAMLNPSKVEERA